MGDIFADIKRAIQAIRDAPPRCEPTVWIHSPRCRAVATGRLRDCNCAVALLDRPLETTDDQGKLTR